MYESVEINIRGDEQVSAIKFHGALFWLSQVNQCVQTISKATTHSLSMPPIVKLGTTSSNESLTMLIVFGNTQSTRVAEKQNT
jgi:hypothetical protein